MRSMLLATASVAGLLAASQTAVAAADNSGFGQLNLGHGWTSGAKDGVDAFDDPTTYGGRAQVYLPLSDPVHFQGDVFAEHSNNITHGGEFGWPTQDASSYGFAVHVIHPMQNARVGAVGSLITTDAFVPRGNGKANFRYGLGALELQYLADNWSFMGQGGLFGALSTDGVEGRIIDGVFIRGGVKYFFAANTSLSGEALLFWGDDSGRFFPGHVSGGTVKVEGEHRFDGSPFSGFVSIGYESERGNAPFDSASQDTFSVNGGIRLYWGQTTLASENQTGAAFNTPDLAHVFYSEGVVQHNADN